jgi:hypothetical protein
MALAEYWATAEPVVGATHQPFLGWLATYTGGAERTRARQIAKCVVGHPIYRAPFTSELAVPESASLQANFAHFDAQRRDRVGHARFFLATFAVDPLDQASVETWLDVHGPLLMAEHDGAIHASWPPGMWAGTSGGLNVVLDLAIALGEAAIAGDPRWSWQADALAWGTYAALTDREKKVDLVREMARCCRQPGSLAALRVRLGVTTLFGCGGGLPTRAA